VPPVAADDGRRRRSAIRRVLLENFDISEVERIGTDPAARLRFIHEKGLDWRLEELLRRR
jgi:hypothetical protein